MKSFLSGRTHVSATSLQPVAVPLSKLGAARAGGHDHAAGRPGATVQCIKQGDQIVRLIVTCTCGEKIEIDCQYPA